MKPPSSSSRPPPPPPPPPSSAAEPAEPPEHILQLAVIGAGLSGLVAARHAQARGVLPVVFNSSENPGGRTYSLATAHHGGPYMFDCGAIWHTLDAQPTLAALLAELDVPTFRVDFAGDHLIQSCSCQAPPERFPGGMPEDNLLQFQRGYPPVVGRLESPPDRCPIEPRSQHLFQIQGGYAAVVHRLVDQLHLPVRTGHVLVGMDRTEDSSAWQLHFERLRGDPVSVRAARVVLAYPPSTALDKLPYLRAALSDRARAQLLAGPTLSYPTSRMLFVYRTAFWERHGLRGSAWCKYGAIETVQPALSVSGHPQVHVLVCTLRGEFRRLRDSAVRNQVIDQLEVLFGFEARKRLANFKLDFSRLPYLTLESLAPIAQAQKAAPDPFQTRTHVSELRKELRALRLAFAGTEVASEHSGSVEGALIAAYEAIEYTLRIGS